MDDDDLLDEQQRFYRARAPEYDQWWQRQGRYASGEEDTRDWRAQVARIDAALAAFGATGDVLELAGGTGWWTQRLAATADRLTVVDGAPETLELNRRRVDRADVEYIVADLFRWHAARTYDVVFFSFWLSHVPRPRFPAFWASVRASLAPGGRVFVIDNREDQHPRAAAASRDPYVVDYGPDLHLRRLEDGSEHRVVKVMYEPDELRSLLDAEGWEADIDGTRWFWFGSARPRSVG